MDRRLFLRNTGFLTVSVALGGLAGCGGGSDSPGPGGALPATPQATGSGWKFPQSVASGDPVPDGIMLWTRVVPATADDVTTAATAANFSIRLLVTEADNGAALGSNAALAGTAIVDSTIPVYALYDNTVRNKVSGLKAGTTYYYQFIAGDVRSRVGRFKTAPAKTTAVPQLKLAFMTCQDYTVNHWAAFDYIVANEDLDLIVHLGDYIYETVGESFQIGLVETRHDPLVLPDGAFKSGASGAKYASTLADYRYLYKKYRSDARLQAVHERFAFVATWDDHEFSDDCWKDAETYDNGFYDAALGGWNLSQPERRRSASHAWFEFMPADVRLDESAAAGIYTLRIYRDLQWGSLAHLIVTDERLYRSDHIIPEAAPNPATGLPVGPIGSRYIVPQATRDSVEASKIAASPQIDANDPLTLVSILGHTQRDWWKSTLGGSPATWKLWCNEVSLLRMQLDGTAAISALIALQSVSTLASSIQTALAATGGNAAVASALVAAVTAGASQTTAGAAAGAIAVAVASAADPLAAAVAAGLSTTQAGIAVSSFNAATAAAAGGIAAQVGAGAQTIAFGYIKPDIQANGVKSGFVVASGKAAALAPFFTNFLLNCDQWDGYNAERVALMKHIKDNNISNVVALTGDLHCFHAGTVRDDFDSASGKPVMVDLVTAGISSESFFTYFADSVGAQSPDLAALIYYPLAIPVTGLGTVNLRFNVFDFTLAGHPPTLDQLAEQARVPLRTALAAKGVAQEALDATTSAVLTGLKADPNFSTQLLGLARTLAGISKNPWINWSNTDAQGYSVVTLTPDSLVCNFKQVNRLVGANAPATSVIAKTVTATIPAGSASVTIS